MSTSLRTPELRMKGVVGLIGPLDGNGITVVSGGDICRVVGASGSVGVPPADEQTSEGQNPRLHDPGNN